MQSETKAETPVRQRQAARAEAKYVFDLKAKANKRLREAAKALAHERRGIRADKALERSLYLAMTPQQRLDRAEETLRLSRARSSYLKEFARQAEAFATPDDADGMAAFAVAQASANEALREFRSDRVKVIQRRKRLAHDEERYVRENLPTEKSETPTPGGVFLG